LQPTANSKQRTASSNSAFNSEPAKASNWLHKWLCNKGTALQLAEKLVRWALCNNGTALAGPLSLAK
jgi:hypothetical protein